MFVIDSELAQIISLLDHNIKIDVITVFSMFEKLED